ncbi:recombination protein NinB [Moraxella nasovis]|uniref:recombination protein NinB n=1 Tax=Moraxella nasovis TaxID=2904121 RepID=UPI001F61F739|nr:recombination protein NinB [Moraxella nasovis]UNU74129.1 recombination protein NinB [Moraxella nasovis]
MSKRYRITSDNVLQNCVADILTRQERGEIVNVIITDKDETRSQAQNRLQRLWVNELAEQGDLTAEEYRAYCKLHFGVPILRNENEEFRATYDERVKYCYSYEQKLQFMALPFDFPVTRLMTVKQHKRYLDDVYVHYTGLGYVLTIPDDLRWCYER